MGLIIRGEGYIEHFIGQKIQLSDNCLARNDIIYTGSKTYTREDKNFKDLQNWSTFRRIKQSFPPFSHGKFPAR